MTGIRVNPKEGTYDSETLRKAVDVLAERGIMTIRGERDADGYAVIHVPDVSAALALHLLTQAEIDSVKIVGTS